MIIDIECDIPTKEVREADLASFEQTEDEGMGNYINIFGAQWAEDAGMSLEEFESAKKTMKPMDVRRKIAARAIDTALSEDEFITMLDDAGITRACIGTGRHASAGHTLALADKYPDRFIPWARISPTTGMAGVRELEGLVKERGLKGLEVSCFREKMRANDKK